VRVLIAGGGTGGHLYPGIALARELQRRDPSNHVSFVGTAQGIEARVVPREGFELDLIHVAGLKGKSRVERAIGFGLLPIAALDSWRVIAKRRPDVVVGVGGFASGPVLAIAALLGYPTMLLEQNAVPGITNRLLARVVRAAAVNFEAALSYFPRTGFVAGNPVRPEFFSAENEEANDHNNPFDSIDSARGVNLAQGRQPRDAARVLIFGGSQGAHAINVAMVEAAARLAASGIRLAITHQTGERDLDLVRTAYQRAGMAARVEAFIYEIDREMKAADVVIARSGATTLAELAASGTPAVLVPLPTATDDHQRKNAEVVAQAGAAVVVEERGLNGDTLAAAISALVSDEKRRRDMATAARKLARPDAAARIADRAEELALRLRSGQGAGRAR
jgi:UDP-N-acetylglucosamine--N-acetylmuramyl-(pentapeptide) pyrophosphoryl-undecaprenol N-acetylglucosamine transferase